MTSGLHELAAELGLETGYWDVRGQRHEASDEALLAAARAAGAEVAGLADAGAVASSVAAGRVGRGLPPVVVAWQGVPASTTFWAPEARLGTARVVVAVEAGGERRWDLDLASAAGPAAGATDPGAAGGAASAGIAAVGVADVGGSRWVAREVALPGDLPAGYHELAVELGGDRAVASLLVAPRRVVGPEPWERTWGVVAPLYGVRRTGSGPDVGDLDRIGAWLAGHGGQVVATLPILATYLDRPFEPSPYAPVSRCFWNELYLDLDHLPGLDGVRARRAVAGARGAPGATGMAGVGGLAGAGPAGRGGLGGGFDHRGRAVEVRRVVEAAAAAIGDDLDGLPAYRRFEAEVPEVPGYAAFRATAERHGQGWHAWPDAERLGLLADADRRSPAARYHRYAQWALHEQLGQLASSFRGRGQRLYLDLPVGSHAEGWDTWRERHLFAWGVSTGAPPDEFFEHGQSWGFPPLAPGPAREGGHRFLAACLRAHLRVAGTLRLDHVMQLERLWWVPDGMPASDGVYARYPREELLAVLAIESHRAGAVVVGEDLGTVPDQVRASMDEHGLLGMYVLQFEVPDHDGPLRPPTPGCVASLNTHDTPTFASWVQAADVDLNRALDLVDDQRADEIRQARRRQVAALAAALAERGELPPEGDVVALAAAALRLLGASDAATVLVALDDLWGGTEPQNVPGTPTDRPNWVLRWSTTLDDLVADPQVAAVLDGLQAARLGAHERAKEHVS